jgi:hypothetical protein
MLLYTVKVKTDCLYTNNIQDIIESTIWNILFIINVCVYPEMYFEQVFVCDFFTDKKRFWSSN